MPGGIRKRVASLPARVRGRLAAWWGWTLTRADNVPRIARWEVTKNAGSADRRTLAVALLAVAGIAVLLPLAAGQGVALDEGIYRVGVSEESPVHGPADSDGRSASKTRIRRRSNPAARRCWSGAHRSGTTPTRRRAGPQPRNSGRPSRGTTTR